MAESKVSSITSRLLAAKNVAQADPAQQLKGSGPDAAVAQSIINQSVDIASLKGELEKVRSELALHKAKLVDLENCLGLVDGHLQALQNDHLNKLVDRVQGVVDAQVQILDRVASVENKQGELSGSLTSVEDLRSKLRSVLG